MISFSFFRKAILLLAVASLSLVVSSLPVNAGEMAQPKKVLILNSYHQGYRGSDDFVEGFRGTLFKALHETEIRIEYLDSINNSGKEFDNKILDLLRFKYQQRHFDLIFSTDDYAFNLLEKYRDSIFGATPVVFCGTNSFDSSRLKGKQGFNGLDERPSFGDTLKLIFRLHPNTSDVVVIHDTSVTGQRNSEEFRTQAAPFANRARFSYLAGLSLEELTRRAGEFQPGTVAVYFANVVETRKGEVIPTGEVSKRLSAVSRVPIYGGWEFMLGKGMVGGRLLNLREHGAVSALMATKILRGVPPDALAKFSPSPNQYMFDYNQMSRFDILESQLPAGSIVINRPPGFLRSYKVALLSALCVALVLALVNIFTKLLKSRKELSVSLKELQQAQSELMATARKAGMAEIATNVLHNVGNVLNSVNISAGVLMGLVRNSKTQKLDLTAQLFTEHSDDLGEYLCRDPKGKLLPGYLQKLSKALEAERRDILEELSQLTMRVDHIMDIVATQQSHAGASSIIEPVVVAALIDSAVCINAQQLKRHKVTVVKEVAALPVLPLDKARVLQILVNLITNATHAMDGVATGERQLTLGAELTEENHLRLSVSDQGEGIAPESLARIFTHGFTTRKSGHGFGLHSCALAAKEMGGTLTASSPGVGQGATFVLELPGNPG